MGQEEKLRYEGLVGSCSGGIDFKELEEWFTKKSEKFL